MHLVPILSALRRHKTAALLIVLQVALSCAIVCNAVFLIGERVALMQRDSGIDEERIAALYVSDVGGASAGEAQWRRDLATLAAIPGVESASAVNQFPYGSNLWTSGIRVRPDQRAGQVPAAQYMDDGHLLDTLGVRLLQGRGFGADEYGDTASMSDATGALRVPVVLVTRALATRLFADAPAVGRDLYIFGTSPSRVVGVIDDLLVPAGSADLGDHHAIVVPVRAPGASYLVRSEPSARAAVSEAAVAALSALDANRLVQAGGFVTDMRERAYGRDRAVVWLLVAVCIALLLVTALGIVGLASFWVQQRTRQIGVRRALGATRAEIRGYFQIENFVLASAGIALGMLLAYAINQMLMQAYAMSRLPIAYLPVGAVMLWLLGQAAVYVPASRAAAIPPALATRSV